MQLNMVMLLL